MAAPFVSRGFMGSCEAIIPELRSMVSRFLELLPSLATPVPSPPPPRDGDLAGLPYSSFVSLGAVGSLHAGVSNLQRLLLMRSQGAGPTTIQIAGRNLQVDYPFAASGLVAGVDLPPEDPYQVLVLIAIAAGSGLISFDDLFALLFSKKTTGDGLDPEPKDEGDIQPKGVDGEIPRDSSGNKHSGDTVSGDEVGDDDDGNGKKPGEGKEKPSEESAKKPNPGGDKKDAGGDPVPEDNKKEKAEDSKAKKGQGEDPNEKKLSHFQSLEFLLAKKAYNVYMQSVRQNSLQILQDTQAALLKEKFADLAVKLEAMAAERNGLDLKMEGIKKATADLERREAVIIKEKDELELGRKEVAADRLQVSSEQKRVAEELASVENDKYNLFIERKVLQDLVKASQEKKRSAIVKFLKWFASGPRILRNGAVPFLEWLSIVAALLALGSLLKSGKNLEELWDIVVKMIVNEYNDFAEAWAKRIEGAQKTEGGKSGGKSEGK